QQWATRERRAEKGYTVVTFSIGRTNQASGSNLEPATRLRSVDARLLHGLADDLRNSSLRDDARFRIWPGQGGQWARSPFDEFGSIVCSQRRLSHPRGS